MGKSTKMWCDQCGSEGHDAYFNSLHECDVCLHDVCEDCSHETYYGRACDVCSSEETACHACGASDNNCEHCWGDCPQLLCEDCAQFPDGKGEGKPRYCDDHTGTCGMCELKVANDDLAKCGAEQCDKEICDDCGATYEEEPRCEDHIIGSCNLCYARLVLHENVLGCDVCLRCSDCAEEETVVNVCTHCAYSSICAVCRTYNDTYEGSICKDCTEKFARGGIPDHTERDALLRANEYAYRHHYSGAIHPDEADELTDDELSAAVSILPTVAASDQRVLTPTQGNSNPLTEWGDISVRAT